MSIDRGVVYLVGAGPGDPDLITVRGLSLLRQADVVVHDRLVARSLLDEVRPDAEVIDAGKAPGQHRYAQQWINALLVGRAKKGRSVVRLKGGDPFVFGRGFEELTACREAGVPCGVVPGVSSAIAAPASVGIPVTTRGAVRSVAIVTGQVAGDGSAPKLNYTALAAMDTIVILMGRANLPELIRGLIDAGRDSATPAACVERATTPDQRVTVATLGTLVDAVDRAALRAPVVTVIGRVAGYAAQSEHESFLALARQSVTVPRAG